MILIAFIAGLLTIFESLFLIRGDKQYVSKSILYCSMAIVLFHFAVYAYPEAKPEGVYLSTTEVQKKGQTYTLQVDISIEYVEITRDDYDSVVKVYKPKTIYWPSGGYTNLEPELTEFTEKSKRYVWAYGYNEDEEYKIFIPQISFRPTDKLLSMGWGALYWLGSIGMGLIAIIISAAKQKNDRQEVMPD